MKNCYPHIMIRVFLLASITVGLGCFKPDVIIPPGPPKEGFVLGPEDVIEVVVWRTPDLSRQVVIRPDGKISLPLIGDVLASGLTADFLASALVDRFKEYKENPSVSVNVLEVNSYYVFIVGEVTVPGKLQLKTYTTLLQAISLAGGFTQFASRNDIRIVRNVINADGNIGSSLFRADDFIDATRLAVKLRNGSDRVSKYIHQRLTQDTRQLLDDYEEINAVGGPLQDAFIQELNQLLQGNSLYDDQRFEHVTLRPKTMGLIDKKLWGEDRIALNRLLLEDAYPHELAKARKIQELRIPIRYDDLVSDDGAAYNITLKSGDTIIVP